MWSQIAVVTNQLCARVRRQEHRYWLVEWPRPPSYVLQLNLNKYINKYANFQNFGIILIYVLNQEYSQFFPCIHMRASF